MKPVEKELCKAILDDPAAQAQIVGAADDEERASIIVRLGDMFGLPVSLDAVRAFFAGGHADELSDMELEFVVGGKDWFGNSQTPPPPIDELVEGDGNDNTLWGRDGNDTLLGHGGNDQLIGDGSSDGDHSHDGHDSIDGGAGNDTAWGMGGDDTILGGDGDDELMGDYGGGDIGNGHEGNDFLDGGAGNDRIAGDGGDDTLLGGEGNDVLGGGTGADSLDGGAGNDRLYGGEGHDTIRGGAGDDALWGGDGFDAFVFGTDDGNDIILDFNPTRDVLSFEGISGPDDLTVTAEGINTVIAYGDTQVVLHNVQMTAEEVWARVER